MTNNIPTTISRHEAIIAVLVGRYGIYQAMRIHELATTTHKGRLDSSAYSRWVDAAKEARDGKQS